MDMSGDALLLLRTILSSKWNPRSDEPQASMKYQAADSDILGMPADSLLMGACWGPGPEQYKLLLDAAADEKNSLDTLDSKVAMDTLDSLLMSSTDDEVSVAPDNFAELKPLPPFTGYTGHLSINGISGHHYHAIAAPLSPEPSLSEPNNNTQLANHNHGAPVRHTPHSNSNGGNNGNGAQNGNVTAAAVAAAAAAAAGGVLNFKGGSDQGGATLYYSPDQGVVSSSTGLDCSDIKEEAVDYNSILDSEDIAALIGSAIADTTVPSVVDDGNASRDSWMDLDAWIDTAVSSDGKTILTADSLQEFSTAAVITAVANCAAAAAASSSQFSVSPPPANATTLQSLLGYPVTQHPNTNGQVTQQQQNGGVVSQGSQPVLVKREATTSFNGHPGLLIKREATTSSFPHANQQMSLLHSRLQNGPPSPPGHVVSTTDPGLRYHYSPTSTTAPNPSKKSRNRSKSKSSNSGANNSVLPSSSSLVYSADGLLGKEKTVHRCTICSRGFLNKSNIKVHLRTHTGEKPFRCDVCGKAFRQKAHLLKHAMIHKRVGRDDPCGVGYGPHEALRCD